MDMDCRSCRTVPRDAPPPLQDPDTAGALRMRLRLRLRLRGRWAVGAIVTVIGVPAYAGLVATAIGAFGSIAIGAAWRGHWVAD